MPTRLRIFGVRGPSGEKQAARLYLPVGQSLPGNLALASPAWTFTTGATAIDLPLAEVGTSGQYGCDVNTSGGNLPDTVTLPYEYLVVAVAVGTDLTNQASTTAAITTALGTAGNARRSRQLYDQMGGPFLASGVWLLHPYLTGDAFVRLGAPAGASIAADIATRSTYAGGAVASVSGAVGSVTGNVGGNVVGSVASVTAAVAVVNGTGAGQVPTVTQIGVATWASGTRTLTSDPAAGNGDTLVNQNTGGVDNLQYLDISNNPVDNGLIRAYLTSDYTANAATARVRANATTIADGRWANPMYLDHGLNYTFVFEKPGVLNAVTATVTV